MTREILTLEDLNRAYLARQLLLERAEGTTAEQAVARLVGLQAQQSRPPFIGLWTRLAGFSAAQLAAAVAKRSIVRATLMRATLHLMGAADYLALRGALQPALTRAMRSVLRRRADGLDLDALAAAARQELAGGPLTFAELRVRLAERFPGSDERAMGYAVRTHLPLVQVPDPEAPWAYKAAAPFADAVDWLGAEPEGEASERATAELIRRYLAAFGPATARDAQTWSGLTGLRPVFEALRPELRVFADEEGRELFDLHDAPRPPGETEAPVRFVPDYDNLVLGHADRRRIVSDEHRGTIVTKNLRVLATFLVDGFVAGTWRIERRKKVAILRVEPFAKLDKKARIDLALEGQRLMELAEPAARPVDVRFA